MVRFRAHASKHPDGPRRLLVVDDDDELTEIIIRAVRLAAPDLQTDRAHSAQEGRELVRRHRYDVVLIDQYLDGGELGVDLVKPAKRAQPQATVAMMSSIGVDGLLEITRRHGSIPLIAKPFSAAVLHNFMHEALDLPGLRVAHVAPLR
ncbi:MAG: response regulator [bacterium]|nr:response regulator [bacterium]